MFAIRTRHGRAAADVVLVPARGPDRGGGARGVLGGAATGGGGAAAGAAGGDASAGIRYPALERARGPRPAAPPAPGRRGAAGAGARRAPRADRRVPPDGTVHAGCGAHAPAAELAGAAGAAGRRRGGRASRPSRTVPSRRRIRKAGRGRLGNGACEAEAPGAAARCGGAGDRRRPRARKSAHDPSLGGGRGCRGRSARGLRAWARGARRRARGGRASRLRRVRGR